MIYSMTAFAREQCETPHGALVVELRSVNHRYLELHCKLPDVLRDVELALRDLTKAKVARGKLDCQLRLHGADNEVGGLAIDDAQLARVMDSCRKISERWPGVTPPNTMEILQFPGVCRIETPDTSTLGAAAIALFERALLALLAYRQREGAELARLVGERLEAVKAEVASARIQLPLLLQSQRERLLERLAAIMEKVDTERLEQELVYTAQKSDVAEELDRLEAHVKEVQTTLAAGGACGRRLDFLMQEMNREANTLSSKSLGMTTTLNAVELKVLIEQMREQIQNIE